MDTHHTQEANPTGFASLMQFLSSAYSSKAKCKLNCRKILRTGHYNLW